METLQAKNRVNPTRLVLSGLLITASVVGFWLFLEASKTTESYLVTRVDLSSGSPIVRSELDSRELSLFQSSDKYLKSADLPEGAYLTRPISSGEVIPVSAVTTQLLDDWTNLVLTPSIEPSAQIGPGSKVLVWASTALDYQTFGEPVIVAVDVEVVSVRQPQGNFAGATASVELRVPADAIAAVLRSIANGDSIALTATSASIGG